VGDVQGDVVAAARARYGDDVDAWLAGLSKLVVELIERWELAIGEPFDRGSIGYAAPATRADGDEVVLKISYPDGWFSEEVAALARWDGDGAVELIDHDPRGAMLLERAVPGTPLVEEPNEERALSSAADVLERLWRGSPDGITSVGEEVGRWAASFRDRNDAVRKPVPSDLAKEAVSLMDDLIASAREQLLLHGDLHLGNVLAAERQPWLAIAPQPLVGDREFDVTALIRGKPEQLLAKGEARERRRFDHLADRLSCDRDRLRAWSIAVTTDYALSCWENGDAEAGRQQLALAELFRGLRT
jgi:streptomycin 6-kinase